MARARNIKPGFFLNDELAEVELAGRLLFAGLWCIADREGRLEDRPKKIKAEVLPYDNCDVDGLLNQLQQHRFVTRYEVDGAGYIQIANFTKHQNPHPRESKSEIPPMSDETLPSNLKALPSNVNKVANPADSLIPDPSSLILIPDSLIPHQDPPNPKKDDPQPTTSESSDKGDINNGYRKSEFTTAEFETFWNIYPRQVDRRKAWRCWKTLLEGKVNAADIIIATTHYADAVRGSAPKFIKHPATFLGPDRPYEEWIKGSPQPDPKARPQPKPDNREEKYKDLYIT
jgi:hypothetical protein